MNDVRSRLGLFWNRDFNAVQSLMKDVHSWLGLFWNRDFNAVHSLMNDVHCWRDCPSVCDPVPCPVGDTFVGVFWLGLVPYRDLDHDLQLLPTDVRS